MSAIRRNKKSKVKEQKSLKFEHKKSNLMKEAINNINFDFYDDTSGAIRGGLVEVNENET
tara:strand:- start:651 stop:830 length:180 start_codon:yes stop_codon:yes gene_type:complete